jgi:hypothetical protein
MGELKFEKSMTIREASVAFKKSPHFIRKYIKLGVIPVLKFGGKPIKPYQILYKDLDSLFTVASIRSLTTEDLAKRLGRKPLKKEEFKWPK